MPAISFGKNLTSLRLQRELGKTSTALSSNFQRLSSGVRINDPSDDAAGAAVAAALKLDSKVFTQGVRNLNDGISALSIAENGLSQARNILGRVKELAAQAANGAYSSSQRQALDTEADALVDEYNRILQSTTFNDRKVLDGTYTNVTFQGGFGTNESLAVTVADPSTITTEGTSTTVGDGTFASSISSRSAFPSGQFVLGDTNNDGALDLIHMADLGGSIAIQRGTNDGAFADDEYVSIAGGGTTNATGFAFVDVTGDSYKDIVLVTGATASTMQVLVNNGNATFASAVSYAAGNNGTDLAAADLDGDGDQDIVTSQRGSNQVSVFLNNGNGTYAARVSYSAGVSTEAVTLADLNGDGRAEIIAVSRNQSKIYVFNNNGSGSFAAGVSIASGTTTYDVAAADMDGDGDNDIVTVSSGDSKVNVHLNNSGTLAAAVSYAGGTSNISLSLGDFNGDNRADVLVNASLTNSAQVLMNSGTGTLGAGSAVFSAANSGVVRAGDVNADGVSDLILQDSFSEYYFVRLTNTTTSSTSGSSTSSSLTLSQFDLSTQSAAQSAIASIQTAYERVELELGKVGSYQSRFSTAVRALGQRSTETQAAHARITDVDFADETAKMLRNQIKQDTATALLAQANQVSEIALRLLGA